MPPDEEKGITLGGPLPILPEQQKASDPSSFLNPMPGVPTMAAPPAGAFARPQGRPLAGMENKYQNKALNPRGPTQRWSGVEVQRLYKAAKDGLSPTELQEIFPNRTMRSIQNQIERLFGGFRKLRPSKSRYPLLKDDEFSQMHPELQKMINEPAPDLTEEFA